MGFRFLLAVALLAAAGTSSAAGLGFAHYAPGAGDVAIAVDGRVHALSYRDFLQVTQYEAGMRHVRATAADGRLLAEGELALSSSDRYIVILAGNGSQEAPYELRLATDHNHVFVLEQWSLQTASLAIRVEPDTPGLAPLRVHDTCRPAAGDGSGPETFGHGAAPIGETAGTGDVAIVNGARSCSVTLSGPDGETLDTTAYGTRPGERVRRFLIGDGVLAPYEVVVVSQGLDPVLPVMEPDASIEGLFTIEGSHNTGLQVAYNAAAPAGERISAVYFGFENDGRASWRTLENGRVIEYVGGHPDGSRAAVGFERSRAEITAHSCRELSMKVTRRAGPADGQIFPAEPRNTLRLTRLFPPVCPPAVPTGQETKP